MWFSEQFIEENNRYSFTQAVKQAKGNYEIFKDVRKVENLYPNLS